MEHRTLVSPPRAAARSLREWVRMGAAGAAVLVAVTGLYLTSARYEAPVRSRPTASVQRLPSTIGTLDLAWSLSGAEALREVRDLHVGDFRIAEAEVAGYGGSTTVWVAEPARANAAADLVTRMADAIAEGSTPFAEPVEVASSPGVWRTDGAGQQHAFFAADGGVWWLAADAADLDDALGSLLKEVRP